MMAAEAVFVLNLSNLRSLEPCVNSTPFLSCFNTWYDISTKIRSKYPETQRSDSKLHQFMFRKPSLLFIGRKSQFYIPYKLLNFQSVIKYYAWVTHDVGKTDRTHSIRVCALIISDDKDSAVLKHLQTFELSIFIGIWVL